MPTAWEMYVGMDGEQVVGIYAKNPDKPEVLDVTDDLAHLLQHRASATPPKKPSLDDLCPDPVEKGWTMRQCFDAHKCSCARGAAMGYRPTTMPQS